MSRRIKFSLAYTFLSSLIVALLFMAAPNHREPSSESEPSSEMVHEFHVNPTEGHSSCFQICTNQGWDEADCEDECTQDA